MSKAPRVAAAFGIGLLAGAAALGVATTPVRLLPGAPGWARCVAGTAADGGLVGPVVVRVPGVSRSSALRLVLETEGGPADLSVAADRVPPVWLRVSGRASSVVALPITRVPGLRLLVRSDAGAPAVRLRRLEIQSNHPLPWALALLVFATAAGLTAALAARLPPRLSLPLALFGAGLLVVGTSPLLLWWSLPSLPALARVAVPGSLLVAGAVLAWRAGEARRFAIGAALLGAAVFGVWARAYFLPSAGSWDVDYWKGCALRTSAHGVTRAYGDPESVPPGHFLAQLRGTEPAWELPAFGRTFVIDQPPGIMLLWKWSWRLLSQVDHGMTTDEALNVAAKLPTVVGDLLAVGVLVWAFERRLRGFVLAALYWALPVSWLSGAVLGFFDGAYVPVAVAALVAAGRGRAVAAGLLLAGAALLKSLALLMAPAVAVALYTARAPLRKAILAGSAVVGVSLVPFVLDGTLATTVIHIYRIIFQERLSGGYGNGWWVLSHALTLGTRAATDKIPYVRIEAIGFPVRPLATLAFVAVAIVIVRAQRRAPGAAAAALAGAALVLTYGQLAIGIHENHPHAFVLALVATGLSTPRLRALAAVFFATYVLNMLALSGLGRFYTERYAVLDPMIRRAGELRLGLGFDLTLAVAIVNILAFAFLLWSLRGEMQALAGGEADQTGATRSPESQRSPAATSNPPAAVTTAGNSSR